MALRSSYGYVCESILLFESLSLALFVLRGPQRNSTAQPRAFRGQASFNGGGDSQCMIHNGILMKMKMETNDGKRTVTKHKVL